MVLGELHNFRIAEFHCCTTIANLPLIATIGALAYAEPLDPFVLLGGGVVIAANLLNLWGERRRRA